ncbi:MAG: molybdopterin molybdotransferase MoeA [Cyclobacteriaceae bacterium]
MEFITYEQALDIIDQHPWYPEIESIEISQATQRVLAEDIVADRDFPPFDRVTMDGIAISYAAFKNGIREFKIEATQAAGAPALQLQTPDGCIEIMTGAMLSKGADTIIKYEEVEIKDEFAQIITENVAQQQNVHFKGLDQKSGDVLIKSGHVIGAAEIGVLSTVGKHQINVLSQPKALVVSTGDELVDVSDTPLAHQIRKSNVWSVYSKLTEWGVTTDMMHLNDTKEVIYQSLKQAIEQYDFIVMSGGVSKGKFDYIPEVLNEIGVTKHFHRVKQRPGKPFWFGTTDSCRIFALPGNPVATFMCLNTYVRRWLLQSHHQKVNSIKVSLTEDIQFKPDLTFFQQVKIDASSGHLLATPIRGNGSGDFANLTNADGFVVLPHGQSTFSQDEQIDYIPYRNVV